ncbi:MAG TPA: M64 family metallopeptidase [Polyangia bacterium]|jgi:hypothetical protein
MSRLSPVFAACALALAAGCAPSDATSPAGTGGSGQAGSTGSAGAGGTTGSAGTTGSGGAAGTGTGGTTGSGGVTGTGATAGSGSGGTAGTGTAGSSGGALAGRGGGSAGTGGGSAGTGGTATGGRGGTGTGGSVGGRGGAAGGAAGRGGSAGGGAGSSGTTGTAGAGGTTPPAPLDCGPDGWVIENHGPPANRINFVIYADGYNASQVAPGGLVETHANRMWPRRWSDNAQPYARYRNFVNICVLRPASTGTPGMFGCQCTGDRVGSCNTSAMMTYANQKLPKSLIIDWRAGMFNTTDYCNSGGQGLLTLAGGHSDEPAAALHEGGHAFHALADEYSDCTGANCGANTNSTGTVFTAYQEINSAGNPMTTDGKWDKWIGYNQVGATGIQSTWSHSRYNASNYRPTANSMMNSMFCNTNDETKCTPNTAFNSVSREQIVMSIWKKVRPIDSTEPAAGAVTSPGVLKVNVVDPAVINVDWDVDGAVTKNGGTTLDTSTLAAGAHTIKATAYDNAGDDLVRYKDSTCPSVVGTGWYCHRNAWKNSTQTVMWTFTK